MNPIDAILDTLAAAINGCWVSDELPQNDRLERNLPAIVVRDDAPGWTDGKPWGGTAEPVFNVHAVDIEIYGRDLATIRTLGTAVSQIVHAMILDDTNPVVSVRSAQVFHTRPDWNPRVRRVGAEFAVTTARR